MQGAWQVFSNFPGLLPNNNFISGSRVHVLRTVTTLVSSRLAEIPVLHVRRERGVLRDTLCVPLHRRPERYSPQHSRGAIPNPNSSSPFLASSRCFPLPRSLWRSPLHCTRCRSCVRVRTRTPHRLVIRSLSLSFFLSSPVSPHHRSHPAPAPAPVAWEHSALPLPMPSAFASVYWWPPAR